MNDRQWKILIKFMRFTMEMLFNLSFKDLVRPLNYGDYKDKKDQFIKDTDEWL